MYTAWCCSGRCADLMNAWLNLTIPLPPYFALPPPGAPPPLPPPVPQREEEEQTASYGRVVPPKSTSLDFNNSPVVKLLFCTIFHKTHYVPCL